MNVSKAASVELCRLAESSGGTLRPSDVVDAARDRESPLHPYFTWDDSAAAAAYRLQQARALIRVSVTYVPAADDKPIRCRVFASLTPDRTKDGAGYRLVSVVMADEELRRQLLLDARGEMKRFKAKYETLEELVDVFAAMDEADTQISTITEHVAASA